MPQFSEVIFNPTRVVVAQLNNDNTYATPVDIDYFQKMSFDIDADEDEIKSAGLIVEALSIATNVNGSASNGSLNYAAMGIIQGDTPTTSYGTTPNRYQYVDITVGGAGNPYFGMIVSYASTLGGNLIVGFPKTLLKQKPGFDVDQNKFRIGQMDFRAFAPNTIIRRAARLLKYETAASIVLSSAYFAGFFNGMF